MADLRASWTRRLFERTGLGTISVGVVLLAIVVLGFAIQELLLGRLAVGTDALLGRVRITLVHIVISVYVLTAFVYCQQSRDATIERLRPLLDPVRAQAALGTAPHERALLLAGSLVGVVVAVMNTWYVSPGPASYVPSSWDPETGWHRVLGLFIGFWSGRLSVLIVLESTRLSALAASLRRVDLLALDELSEFAARGLANALVMIGAVSVFALFLVDSGYVGSVVGLVLFSLVVGGVALLLPLRGVRERVRAAKRAELAWCRERLRAARASLESGPVDGGELPALVAWESRVESINEWPVDASTFTRFGLYLLIPLGSWAGGAIVERMVDALLD